MVKLLMTIGIPIHGWSSINQSIHAIKSPFSSINSHILSVSYYQFKYLTLEAINLATFCCPTINFNCWWECRFLRLYHNLIGGGFKSWLFSLIITHKLLLTNILLCLKWCIFSFLLSSYLWFSASLQVSLFLIFVVGVLFIIFVICQMLVEWCCLLL